MNGLWRFPLYNPEQGKQQSNMILHSTSKQRCQHIKPMTPRQTKEYHPKSQQDLATFYHQILCCPTKRTLFQKINDGSFATYPGLIQKLITNYIPDSELTSKENLDQQKQRLVPAAAENVTHISTKIIESTNKILLQLFD